MAGPQCGRLSCVGVGLADIACARVCVCAGSVICSQNGSRQADSPAQVQLYILQIVTGEWWGRGRQGERGRGEARKQRK